LFKKLEMNKEFELKKIKIDPFILMTNEDINYLTVN